MKPAQRIPVLMYHQVGAADSGKELRYCVPPERFAAQMRSLANKGMRACSIEAFFAWLEGRQDLPEGSFLLTFDDGFLGVYEHAAPVLQELGWPATVFLVSALTGGEDEWRRKNPGGLAHSLMGAEHIAALRRQGFTFHSHTRHHADLPTLADAPLADELAGSRLELESLLGEAVPYLAYPYGHHDQRVIHAAQAAGYEAAFSVQPGFNRQDVDRYRIRRLDIFGTDTPAMLARKIFFGSNDGRWWQVLRYYGERLGSRLGIRR
jgi:peptidoglycan/xylan/chitin deacetylase (PgdA/CDA1 family)